MTALKNKFDFVARWHAFLDAYFNSIELAPPCRQHLFIQRDLDALWTDFVRTQMDFAEANDKIVDDPKRYLGSAARETHRQHSKAINASE